MSIEKSNEYQSSIKTKRLFAVLKEDAQEIDRQIGVLLTAANAMRLSLASAVFGIAQIEALYVDQTESKRRVDAELFTTQAQFAELKAHIAPAIERLEAEGVKINTLAQSTERAATERFIPCEPKGPIEGVTYVDMHYICDAMKTDRKTIRRYIEEGRLRQPDTQEPEDAWIKSLIDQSIAAFRHKRNRRAITA